MVFFGVIAVLLVVLLASQPPAPQGQPVAGQPTTAPEVTVEATVEATAEATAAAQAADTTWNLEPQAVSAGETVFHSICMACHGFNGEGIQGLGKPIVGSEFVNSLTDDELAAFVTRGRDLTDPLNTTGVMMPPRGGNPALSDDDIRHVVAYMRSLNVAAGFGPTEGGQTAGTGNAVAPTAEATTPSQVAAVPTVAQPTVVGGIRPEIGKGELNLNFTSGQDAYNWSCANCHGVDGNPVAPLATLSLSASQLVQAHDDAGLFNFLAQGQPPVNPEEAFPHPYRGGFPQLTDDQIREVITYLYTLAGAH
jgi:disulfide bond formation protein DsbB